LDKYEKTYSIFQDFLSMAVEQIFHYELTDNYFCDKCDSNGLKVEELVKRWFYIYPLIHSLSQKYYWILAMYQVLQKVLGIR